MLVFKQTKKEFPPKGVAGFKLSENLTVEIEDTDKTHTFLSAFFNIDADSILSHLNGDTSKWKFVNTISCEEIYDDSIDRVVFIESPKGFIFTVKIRYNDGEFYTDDALYWELEDGTKGICEDSLKEELEAKETILIAKYCEGE